MTRENSVKKLRDSLLLDYYIWELPFYIGIPLLAALGLGAALLYMLAIDMWKLKWVMQGILIPVIIFHGYVNCANAGFTFYNLHKTPMMGFLAYILGFVLFCFVYVYLGFIKLLSI